MVHFDTNMKKKLFLVLVEGFIKARFNPLCGVFLIHCFCSTKDGFDFIFRSFHFSQNASQIEDFIRRHRQCNYFSSSLAISRILLYDF